MRVDLSRRTAFTGTAEIYDAARPSYPQPLFNLIEVNQYIDSQGGVIEIAYCASALVASKRANSPSEFTS